jgi:hypothetical protein
LTEQGDSHSVSLLQAARTPVVPVCAPREPERLCFRVVLVQVGRTYGIRAVGYASRIPGLDIHRAQTDRAGVREERTW